MNNEITKNITSPDWREERLAVIKKLYPDLFTDEGLISIDEIHALAHNYDLSLGEKFEFKWPGKMQAKKNAFTSSKARLAPDFERSVNFDETKNVIIEGENLEVLKLLSKAYYNKVKCIYIDPPYNTGHDFVYSDDYSEGKQAYWEKNGVFRDGVKVDTNSESAGRYHTNWLNMMMPRLLLAQMILKNDGVIFVSIDDNEVHNLRKLMDEVFGMENFVSQLIWERAYAPKNDAKYISNSHDYVLMYAKSIPDFTVGKLERSQEANDRYQNLDNDPRGAWKASDMSVKTYSANNDYPITTPSGRVVEPPAARCWSLSKNAFFERLEDNRIWFGKDGNSVPSIKRFLSEVREGMTPTSILFYKDVGHSQEGAKEVKQLFNDSVNFDGPKPVRLITRLLTLANVDVSDLVVDFFGGSGTTAQAVMELNKEDGGNRQFILVQIPEAIAEDSEAYKAGYKKISSITIERAKRAGERIKAEKPEVDIGFKVFKLTTSVFPENNFESDPEKTDEENVQAFEEHLARAKQQLMFTPEGKETDLLYETLVKQGFMLTMQKEQLPEFTRNVVWRVTDGDRTAIVCLDADLHEDTVEELTKFKDTRFIGLHRAVDTTKKWKLSQAFGEMMGLV
ncbi:TPA: site-specific DNA-methyltransferase [Candidatus Uhrbacteria bacterium]|nr:site-specific DNA-methyltransferase [Candidatus Uhrbacteria bacterium]